MKTLTNLKHAGVPIETIIDVGVNYSTPALMQAFPKHKHVLIEPISEYFPSIRTNYSGMDYELIEAAANDVDGDVFIESEAKFGDGKVSHSRIVDAPSAKTRTVPSLRLDTMLRPFGLAEPYLLKIDVEGADVPSAILRGATETLRKSSCVVIEMTVPKFVERAVLIADAGFQLFGIEDLCYYGGTLWQADVIFVRNDIIAANPKLRPMTIEPFDKDLWHQPRPPVWRRALDRIAAKLERH